MFLTNRSTVLMPSSIIAALSLSVLALPLFAQTTEEPPRRVTGLEEIVVTAQRREESIRDVPIAMQAFTADTLRRLGVVDTRDLANVIPGFSFADSGFDNPIYTLRGVGFDDYSRTANSTVGVYVDEVPIPYPYMTQGADVDLLRIEVLKGPQGTLYGRNTTGGAINYIANKPADSMEFGVEAEYGRFETLSVESYVSGPIMTDRVRGRLAVRHIESGEGWQKSMTRPGDRLGEKDKQAARLTLGWDPIDSLALNFTLDWWRDRSEPQAPQAFALFVQNTLFRDQARDLGIPPETFLHPDVQNHPLVETRDARLADWPTGYRWTLDNEMLMPALRAYWDFTERMSLTFIAAYTDFETGHGRFPRSGLSVTSDETILHQTDASARSFELRADGRLFNDRLSWLAGVYSSKDSINERQQFIFETNSAPFNNVPGVTPIADHTEPIGEQDARSSAVFANADYIVTGYLSLNLGARYTDESRRFAGCNLDPVENQERGHPGFSPLFDARSRQEGGSGGAGPGECLTLHPETRNPSLIRNKLEEDNLGGKAAINWTPLENHLFYISYSRGYKSGSFPIIPAAEGEVYDPATQERVDAIELGGKTDWLDNALRIDFALFHYDYKDKQLLSFLIDEVFGPLPKLFNAPKSRIRGAELEIQASPLPGLFMSAAAAYLDTEVREFVGTTREGEENVDFSGRPLPFAPERSFNLLANYSFPLPFFPELEGMVGVDYSYTGSARSKLDDDPAFDIPSYKLVNARVGLADIEGRWDVTAWVRNATDEFYQLNVPQFAAETHVRFTGMPRTYGLTVSYRYF